MTCITKVLSVLYLSPKWKFQDQATKRKFIADSITKTVCYE